MKRITKYLTLLLSGSLAALTACGPDMNEVDAQHTPAINSTTLSPLTDESGSTRAYVGTEVTAEGFNLDLVARVTMNEVEAEITEQTIKTLKFKVPALELAQQDAPYQVWIDVFDASQNVIFHYPYYVTVPVTDALITAYAPAEGTVGTEVTLTGRNLEQITRVHFGEVTVEAADFTEVTAEAIKLAVPAGEHAAGDSQLAITAEWGTATIDVTGETLFTLHTPKFDAASQEEGTQNILGDEVTFTGQNLDLVSGMKWGDYELIVMTAEAGSVTVKFPSSIAQTDPVVAEAALTAQWGTPAQTTAVASAWRLDTTPVGPAKPVLISMTAEDGGTDNKFYLGKTVTVKGENLASIEGFKVGGVSASLVGEPTDVEAQFIVPDGVDLTEAAEVAVTALYNSGTEVDFGKAKVYPFYFYSNITIGAQSETNRDKAFFVPDWGRVISTDEWKNLDTKAISGAGIGKNTIDPNKMTEEEYYAQPVYFLTGFSGGSLTLQSPANSSSMLSNFTTSSGDDIVKSGTYGCSVCYFRNASQESKLADVVAAIQSGTLQSMPGVTVVPSAASPKYAAEPSTSTFGQGQIILVAYATYAFSCDQTSNKKPTADDFYRYGYICIHEDGISEEAPGSEASTITFDFYWSKTLNE